MLASATQTGVFLYRGRVLSVWVVLIHPQGESPRGVVAFVTVGCCATLLPVASMLSFFLEGGVMCSLVTG